MDTYTGFSLDLNLIAGIVAIWIVAMSIAIGIYVGRHRLNLGSATRSPRGDDGVRVEPDFDLPAGVAPMTLPTEVAPLRPEAPVDLQPAIETPDFALSESRETPDAFSVLIVDDNAINRQVLELILDSVNIQHASVENGLEAVQAMSNCAYDAVLMDLQMPVMDGFEATRRIREMETHGGGAPSTIIVVSANCLEEHVVAGREAGADAHLAKPISAGALIGELAGCPAVNRIAA